MSFARKATCVIDHTKVPSTQSNFPVCLVATHADLKQIAGGGYMQNANAYDIGISVDGGATFTNPVEIESYDASAGTLILWTLISSLSSSVDTTFILGFGDATLNTNPSSTSVWPSQYKGVWHQANGSTLSLSDSTSNARNGTNASATAITGKVGGGAGYSGSSQSWSIATFDLGNARTYSILLNMTSLPAGANLVGVIGKRPTTNEMAVYVNASGQARFLLANAGNVLIINMTSSNSMSTGTWYKWDFTWDGVTAEIRFNGAFDSSATVSGTLNFTSDNYYIGQEGDGTRFLTAKTDELRMVNIANSLNLSTTEYNNWFNPSVGGFYSSVTFAANGSSATELTSVGVGAVSFTGVSKAISSISSAGVGAVAFQDPANQAASSVSGGGTGAASIQSGAVVTSSFSSGGVGSISIQDPASLVTSSLAPAGTGVMSGNSSAKGTSSLSVGGEGAAAFFGESGEDSYATLSGVGAATFDIAAIATSFFVAGGVGAAYIGGDIPDDDYFPEYILPHRTTAKTAIPTKPKAAVKSPVKTLVSRFGMRGSSRMVVYGTGVIDDTDALLALGIL